MRNKEQKTLNLSGYPDYQEILIDSTGVQIALSIFPVNETAPCVIFLPGTMTHPLFYDDFLTLLAERGFNVVGVHLISHGKSPRIRQDYTFEDMVENVRDTISYCKTRFSGKIILMGSSQGGILSTAVAAVDTRISLVFAHNVLIPSLKESVRITRFPPWTASFHRIIPTFMCACASFFPKLQIPLSVYLDPKKITASQEILDQVYNDPIGLTQYPLRFLASLFSADLSGLTDGSLKCPVVVVLSKDDPLFPYEYTHLVYNKIVAGKKEMLLLNEPCHLIFNEYPERIIDPIAEKLKAYC